MRLCRQGLRLAFALLALFPVTLAAQNFVYTNDNNPSGNTVTAFAVASDGTLSQIVDSPFSTGGTGGGASGTEVAANAIIVVGNFLFVSNDGSNNVSGFTIDPSTGALTLIGGGPAATGEIASGFGISLAATPDGKYLYAGSATIAVLSIGTDGALTETGSSFASLGTAVDGMKVSPDGKYLIAALPGGNEIAVLSIDASTGSLSAVTGSPFASKGTIVAGVDINCAGSQLFVGNVQTATQVDVFNFPPSNGSMTEIAGSPFSEASPPAGQDSQVVALSPDDSELFVSNQGSASVTVFTVAPGGALTLVPGSPFTSGVGLVPAGLAPNQAGTFLYSANFTGSTVSSLAIGTGGSLTGVSGSPFFDPNASPSLSLVSLAAYPAKQCLVRGSFTAKLDIFAATGTTPPGFELDGDFTLGPGGSINLPADPVTVQVGPSYSFTVPAGYFQQVLDGRFAGSYAFSGSIGGVALQVRIIPLEDESYQIKVDASGIDLTGLTNPVSVAVTIGVNTGTAQIFADFK
jgi:6-phosphogluconolactonase (cycloisomerase 2 family)